MNSSLFSLTYRELMQWLFEGKLKSLSQVQKGLNSKWRDLKETEEWKFFNNPVKDENWILLKKSKNRTFEQKGPYSTEQISFFLQMGFCSSKDFIWKKGFTKWKRLSLVSDFSTSPADTIEDLLIQRNRTYKKRSAKTIRYILSGFPGNWSVFSKSHLK